MRRLIGDGISDGSLAAQNPKMLAFTLAGALNWPARWHEAGGDQTPEQIASQLVSILAHGFRPR